MKIINLLLWFIIAIISWPLFLVLLIIMAMYEINESNQAHIEKRIQDEKDAKEMSGKFKELWDKFEKTKNDFPEAGL